MAKSYPEELREWVSKQKKTTPRDRNLVAFLAVRDDVKAAIDAGYSLKTVWANMRETGRIEFGYDTFLNYAKRSISGRATAPSTADAKPAEGRSRAPAATPKPATGTGFTFNSIPNKKDLV